MQLINEMEMDSAALMLLNYLSSAGLVRFEGTLNTELKLSHTYGEERGVFRHNWLCMGVFDCSQPDRYKDLNQMTCSVVAK